MSQNTQNNNNSNLPNRKVKIAGYAQRTFFNDNIEYRNFSPHLVGLEFTSEGGTPLFTNGNFTITANMDPKPNVVFRQGAQSKYYTLDDIEDDVDENKILKNLEVSLNLDLTNPLSYIWYGSAQELIKASLNEIYTNWPAAIYVDTVVGSISGNNITNYVYDSVKDVSTFDISTNYFTNPYGIQYSKGDEIVGTEEPANPLRNFSIHYKSYVVEHNNIVRNILEIVPPEQSTNSTISLTVEGNPFPELTGIIIPQFNIFTTPQSGSIPFFIKPNQTKITTFFSGLNSLQNNLLNRNNYPQYKSIIIAPTITDQGVVITTKNTLIFPTMEDGYNLNFFDSFYLDYLDKLNTIGENYDNTQTDLIIRKYTAEVISSFDTVPRGDGNDLVLNGEKATKLLRIYGVSFDEVKKYINGIKFAHVVTYNKKNNIPDSLVKDLSHMLGLDPVTFVTTNKLNKTLLPIQGQGEFSGTTKSLSNAEVDIELYRRLILNIAWLWKSKGTRKAVEFLFRFIGAPEALVRFDEYIVIVDKPLDMQKLKDLLFLYTGSVDTSYIPYDDNGFPNPPQNGSLVPVNFDIFSATTSATTTNDKFKQLWFQKAGGWYRETLGNNVQTILKGNNPHVGKYDGGNEYLDYFQQCYIPNFSSSTSVSIVELTNKVNHFINYNYGIFNGMPTGTTEFYTQEMAYNTNTNVYDNIDDCIEVQYSVIESPLPDDGIYPLENKYLDLQEKYNYYLDLIKDSPYLRYSPEFITLKNEYLHAKNQYETQINYQNCGVNQALEICLTNIEVIDTPVVDCCDDYESVYHNGFFQVFQNVGDKSVKITGKELKCCCEKLEYNGQPAQYVSFSPPNSNRNIEYCAVESPCHGDPVSVKPNGEVIFVSTSSNNSPIYFYNNKFYNWINPSFSQTGFDACEKSRESYIIQQYGVNSNGTTGDLDNDINEFGQYLLNNNDIASLTEFNQCFLLTNNNSTTSISSAECCAWYGYQSQIVTKVNENDQPISYVVCIDPNAAATSPIENDDSTNLIDKRIKEVSISNKELEKQLKDENLTSKDRERLIIEKNQQNEEIKSLEREKGVIIKRQNLEIKPHIDVTYDKYEPNTNRNTPVEDTISVTNHKDSFVESSVTKIIPTTNNKGESVDLYSPFEDADLNDTKKWEVESIDKMGRVSFSAIDNNNNKQILDWNSTTESGNQLYANVGKENGFVYDSFEVDYNNGSLRRTPPKESPNIIPKPKPSIIAVVDESKIPCDDVENVNILFGSSLNEGFKLPTDEGCECNIDISLDYLIKYDAESLKNCLGVKCNIGIINDLTIESIKCRNFLVFTQNEQDSLLLEQNISKLPEDKIEDIEIWEETVQLEPNVECCNALGGEVITAEKPFWLEQNTIWNKTINDTIKSVLNSNDTNTNLDPVLVDKIFLTEKINSEWENMKKLIDTCVPIKYPLIDNICSIDVNEYITTDKICALPLDLSCGIHTNLLMEYEEINLQIQYAQIKLEECVEERIDKSKLIEDIEIEIIDDKTKETEINNNAQKEKSKISEEIRKINTELEDKNQKVSEKNTDNVVIDKAVNGVNPMKDCSIYQQTLIELRAFNVEGYCSKNTNPNNRDEFRKCIQSKNEEINDQIKEYNELFVACQRNNSLNESLKNAQEQSNRVEEEYLKEEINSNNKVINSLTTGVNNVVNSNENLQQSKLQENDDIFIINKTAQLLGKKSSEIVNKDGNLELTPQQKLELKIQKSNNINEINKLNTKTSELEETKKSFEINQKQIDDETTKKVETINKDIEIKQNIKDTVEQNDDCCEFILEKLIVFKSNFLPLYQQIIDDTILTYDGWKNNLITLKNDVNYQNGNTYIDYMDDLKINFKLFVKQSNGNISSLPYTNSVNPIWEWQNPSTTPYSGIIIGNDNNGLVEQDIIYSLVTNNIRPFDTIFDPKWLNLNYSLPACVCDDLKVLYPNAEFYFGLEIENMECDVCLIVDNIEVNISDCDTQKEITLTNCLIPELSCVIDNKKSWVYNAEGIEYQTIYPDGECNTGSTNNYEVTKFVTPEERLWPELEYRYTEYTNPHSDLIMNTKSTVFAIDPANAIECDVYNFWKNVECEECPTSCDLTCFILGDDGNYLITEDNCSLLVWCNVDADLIQYNGVLRDEPTDSLSAYTLTLTGCCGESFSCNTYTTLLENKVLEMKNEYYSMTGNYSEAINSTYYDFKDKGGSLSNFGITKNNCGSDTIIMGNYKDINQLFGLLIEDIDGTLGLYEVYTFDDTTPYASGTTSEILPGYSAQTFNQTEYLDAECCKSLNKLLNNTGIDGLGLGKNYVWSEEYSACTWTDINNCDGDCSYSGQKKIVSKEDCLSGITTGTTVDVCISPLDYLDVNPKDINVKETFDGVVLSNLIDVKSRQVISDYPMLKLFYQLYLNAHNCGKEFSGKLTYNDLFDFMDKIGDYWLDLLEQVVPATTIWEGCDNSGKLYRNTIFDQNKYKYKRYALNFNDSEDCELSAITENVIASANTEVIVYENPQTPTNNIINTLINQLNNIENNQSNLLNALEILKNRLCAVKLQDPSQDKEQQLADIIDNIARLNEQLNVFDKQISQLQKEIKEKQKQLAEQEAQYTQQILSGCTTIANTLTQAETDLDNLYTPHTLSYENQRSYIAGLKAQYNKCIRKTKTQISKYDTIFITQIYDTNEYEGTVTVIGDPEWEFGGYFYNNGLLHDCTQPSINVNAMA